MIETIIRSQWLFTLALREYEPTSWLWNWILTRKLSFPRRSDNVAIVYNCITKVIYQ